MTTDSSLTNTMGGTRKIRKFANVIHACLWPDDLHGAPGRRRKVVPLSCVADLGADAHVLISAFVFPNGQSFDVLYPEEIEV